MGGIAKPATCRRYEMLEIFSDCEGYGGLDVVNLVRGLIFKVSVAFSLYILGFLLNLVAYVCSNK
jgi:hypothetical protein